MLEDLPLPGCLLVIEKILRTVFIVEANEKCKNYAGNPCEEREQEDNHHRGASLVGNGQRGKDYAQEIPYGYLYLFEDKLRCSWQTNAREGILQHQ